ncbi:DUF397 domain-containing protein [Streptosporangium sp. NBC_01495]|uniref:DUF397 domain-containing protein n=1 Tax=Streptosporangium sp. NBC_01495 TaxID=2903899 RepID=UPI002E378CA4|nr:DUF397 domain-containing protein [Streptosporangium sp. NBC_01495]
MMDLSHVIWRKSSRSNTNGGQCVEVGVWSKSTLSGRNGSSCVEVALTDHAQAASEHTVDAERLFLIRDYKDPYGPVLSFTPTEWDSLLASIKKGCLVDLA